MRLRSVGLKMMPGTNPPPSIRTFFQLYGSEAAADAGVEVLTATCVTTATRPAARTEARAPAMLLRIWAPREAGDFLRQAKSARAVHQGGVRPSRRKLPRASAGSVAEIHTGNR